MKLVIFNGSPRKEKSNSSVLINHFLNGYHKIIENDAYVHYLAQSGNHRQCLEEFQSADTALFVFPLYCDAMPAMVKEFFEILLQNKPDNPKNLAFIVQSGFPEAIHSAIMQKYLQKLSIRLNCNYIGTLTKGGIEGIQSLPHFMTRKLYADFNKLGEFFARKSSFDPAIAKEMARPYKMSFPKIILAKTLASTGLTNFYWNMQLKKNNAFSNRHNRPFDQGKAASFIDLK
jgi:NAD(P)H-dependent FMN reductase